MAVVGRDEGRESVSDLGSVGGIGQSSALACLDRLGADGSIEYSEASTAVAKDATVLTLSSENVRLCKERSISLSRSGVSGVGGGYMPEKGLNSSSSPVITVGPRSVETEDAVCSLDIDSRLPCPYPTKALWKKEVP